MNLPFESISKEWIRLVSQNEKKFHNSIEDVKKQEQELISAMNTLEQLESHSKQTNDAQRRNLDDLDSISKHQHVILKDLDQIEDELDKYLKGETLVQNQYINHFQQQVGQQDEATRS